MLKPIRFGQASNWVRFKLRDSSVATGAGKTGLLSSSAGLIISTIADNEAIPTVYSQAAGTIETIATLGTYAAPTATKCRFRKIDDANHPGDCEFQFADARFAVPGAKELLISVSGAALNIAEADVLIPLWQLDPQLAAPTAAANAAAVWQDTTPGDFTVAGSPGQVVKSIPLMQPITVAAGSGVGSLNVIGTFAVGQTFNGSSAVIPTDAVVGGKSGKITATTITDATHAVLTIGGFYGGVTYPALSAIPSTGDTGFILA